MATRAEKETIINFTEADKTAQVYTTNKKFLNRLKRYGTKPVKNEQGELVDDNGGSTFTVPKNWIRIQRPAAEGREWTDEQKEAARTRLAKVRADRAKARKAAGKTKPKKAPAEDEETAEEEAPKKSSGLKKVGAAAAPATKKKAPVEVVEDDDEEVEVVTRKKKKTAAAEDDDD